MNYDQFLKSKRTKIEPSGISGPYEFDPKTFPFQKDIVSWALQMGRCAIFTATGTGKSRMQIEWARNIKKRIDKKVIIVAPLAVSKQTINEAKKLNIEINGSHGIDICNYESLHKIDLNQYGAVVLDESSRIKDFTAKTTAQMIEVFSSFPYRLCATATPAPNDIMEIGNHSEFLGIKKRKDMLATFFVHDGGDTSKYILKGHAEKKFYEWMAEWSVMINRPSDLGYQDKGYILPELINEIITVKNERPPEGELFVVHAKSLNERRAARKSSIEERVEIAASLCNNSDEQWLVWCGLNSESEMLAKQINDSVEVAGKHTDEYKETAMMDFASGKIKVLVSKASICGFGLNFQNCHNIIFVGLSDSWEQYYQAVRRCWRFGQKHKVRSYIVISEAEGLVLKNIQEKENAAMKMQKEIIERMKNKMMENIHHEKESGTEYRSDIYKTNNATLINGDSVKEIAGIPDGSIDMEIFSPPFSSLYSYSDSEMDMGNCKSDDEFYKHFQFLSIELFRILKAGRIMAVHCMNIPAMKERDGFIGIKDFRGDLIRLFQKAGFIYHSEVCIWKDPVVQMQRTKSIGLLHKQLKKDSTMSRQGLPDYLLAFRKQGENPDKVSHTNETFPVDQWQKYASPVWFDINQSKTLQYRAGRDDNDERHIAPLQLEVIERAIELWSNKGDTIFTPFAGIGSEVYQAVVMGRKGYGIELKRSYFEQSIRNIAIAEQEVNSGNLFKDAI